jgi:lipopolysaccharide export system ATP-binding protein
MTQSVMLEAKGLCKIYGSRKVVEEVSLQLSRGEVVGLLGPNGAGKTTSFYMMVGLVFPTLGRISLGGQDITELALHERSRLGVGYLPQEASLFRKLSVTDNIGIALESLGITEEEIEVRSSVLLRQFGLEKVALSQASSLSGGEWRRCEIARCLATDPKFVLLDEPFAGVDPIAVADIQNIVLDLKARGIGVLITDHNVRETLKCCDRGYLMKEGRIFFHGTPEEISNSSDAREFYLGQSFHLG